MHIIPTNSNKKIRFKTSLLQSHLCDYSDAYVVAKGTTTVTDPNNNACDKKLAVKNNAQFISSFSKINNMLINNAEDFLAGTLRRDVPGTFLEGFLKVLTSGTDLQGTFRGLSGDQYIN